MRECYKNYARVSKSILARPRPLLTVHSALSQRIVDENHHRTACRRVRPPVDRRPVDGLLQDRRDAVQADHRVPAAGVARQGPAAPQVDV